jgi:hypothetical protein
MTELKKQISAQFFSMAEEVDLLRDQRKGLEHQIAELLTFKNKFARMQQLPQRQQSDSSSGFLQVPRSQDSQLLTQNQGQVPSRGPIRDSPSSPEGPMLRLPQGSLRRPLPIPNPTPF